jgi:hypothetical protein
MKNIKGMINNFLDDLYQILPENISFVNKEDQSESMLSDLAEIFSDYNIDDSLLGLEASDFRSEVFKYNMAYVFDFSHKGAKIRLLKDIETLIDDELLFIFKELNKNSELDDKSVYNVKDKASYHKIIESFQQYIDRCYDLSILSNKILKLLESGYTQEELKLSSSNPNLSEFFDHLKGSKRLSNEFSLYIKSIKSNKNKFLDQLMA